jgi:hypothetical protein
LKSGNATIDNQITSFEALPDFPRIQLHYYFVATAGAGERRGVLNLQVTNHHSRCSAKVADSLSFEVCYLCD